MRLLIISNRLPITITKNNGQFHYEMSIGGLATGLSDYLQQFTAASRKNKYLWVGWPGTVINKKEQPIVSNELLQKFNIHPVFLAEKHMEKFYNGFCNKTLWPLFHYFPSLTVYDENYWQSYQHINEAFFASLADIIQEDDFIWIHDYQLMLLPALIRKNFPDVKIGFFLHIPFPDFEIFRLLPAKWRKDILEGLLGSDLIGFHTQEYTRYFLRCVQRILGYEHNIGKISFNDRVVKVDTFPMGINFRKFNQAHKLPEVATEIVKLKENFKNLKVILSLDRLDYTKGIFNRLQGYKYFLETKPSWHEKVVLILIVPPSRVGIEHYQQTKKQIDEIVGAINGRFGTSHWMPIIYQFRALNFTALTALYCISDVALVTPLRDGMNLTAKEYTAAKVDKTGVLVLSEMAGVAQELGEAVIINPNNTDEIASALEVAITMPRKEQVFRNWIMQDRLRNYNITHWGQDFIGELQNTCAERNNIRSKLITQAVVQELVANFKQAKNRILLLDYDGTLVPLVKYPTLAKPNKTVVALLKSLGELSNTKVILISGRDKNTLQKWFVFPEVSLIAEHGAWVRELNCDWQTIKPLTSDWKPLLTPLLQTYTNRVPGSFVEEKEFSVCWHYRNANSDLASLRAKELIDDLLAHTANANVQILPGNKIVEIRNAGVNKGAAAKSFLEKTNYDFILAIGDDTTDEDLFQAIPEFGYSIRVGMNQTHAKYSLANSFAVVDLLKQF